MSTYRRRFLRLCGVVGIGAIAGCSDSSQDTGATTNGQSTPIPTESATSVQSPTATLTPPSSQTSTESTTSTGTSTSADQVRLAANDGDSDDYFGESVTISSDGTTALIGASGDEDPNGEYAGSAYVFENTDGSWSQQAKLTADDGDSDDYFGQSVAISSDGTIGLIAAEDDEPTGSVYIFEATSGGWSQQAILAPDDGAGNESFGDSLAISGDGTTALIGAPADEELSEAGSVYVFENTGDSWSQQDKFTPDDGTDEDFFSRKAGSVAVSNDGSTALVGAYGDADNGDNSGSAYIFESAGGLWSQQAKLTADDGDSGDFFGQGVALSNDTTTALVAAESDEDPNGFYGGSAYVFENTGGSWSQQAKLTPDDGDSGDTFGGSVAMSGDGTRVLIGASRDADPNGYNAGSAYVFASTDGSWTQQAKLAPDNGDEEDRFGSAVVISGDSATALIGANADEDPNGAYAGSAYIFDI